MLSEYKDEFGSLGAYLHAAVLRSRAAAGAAGQQRAAVTQPVAGTLPARPMLATQASVVSSEPGTPTVLQQQQQQRIFLVGAQQPPN